MVIEQKELVSREEDHAEFFSTMGVIRFTKHFGVLPQLLNKRGNILVMTIAYYEFIMSSVFNEILSR